MQLLKKISDRLDSRDGDSGGSPSDLQPISEDASPLGGRSPLADEVYTSAQASAAASALRSAAAAAEALAPQLPRALRRAAEAESEAAELRVKLGRLEVELEALRAQQLRLTEGFEGEMRQRDAELATLRVANERAASKSSPSTGAGGAADVVSFTEVLTFTSEGPFGAVFDRSNDCLKVVVSVEPGSVAAGHIFVGDEVASVGGESARNMTWEEFDESLGIRPVVVSVKRIDTGAVDSTQDRRSGLAGRVLQVAGWTRAAAKAVGQGLEQALTEMDNREPMQLEPDVESSEDRNRPFYALVRSSMLEATAGKAKNPGGDDAEFEAWLRNFHSERDDDWYDANHKRIYNAFRPHWDEVVAAQHARAAF